MAFYSRFLLPENVAEGATIIPLSDENLRRYLGTNVERTSVNLHPIVADYFPRLMFERAPQDLPPELYQALRMASLWRAIYGLGVVMQQGDRYLAIDPRFYWPILVRGVRIGGIIVQPYRTNPGTAGAQVTVPDQALVIISISSDPRAISRVHRWSGVTLGPALEENLLAPTRIIEWGDNVSEFDRAGKWNLDELSARFAGVSSILARHERPHLQAPASALAYDAAGNPTLTIDKNGSVLPVQPDDKEWKYISLDSSGELHKYEVEFLLQITSANLSIPPHVFGLRTNYPRAESGDAIGIDNQVTNARARGLQEEIRLAVRNLGIDFSWGSEVEFDNIQRILYQN